MKKQKLFAVRWLAAALLATVVPLQAAVTQGDPLLDMPVRDPAAAAEPAKQVRGVLRATDQATLSSELNARIVEMPFREGQAFRKGDLLVRFDCAVYQAQLAASQAAMRAAQQELSQNRQLAELKSVGRNAVALAEAKVAQAAAESQVYQIQTSHCKIIAPFAGQVVTRKAQVSEFVGQGMPLLEIVDNSRLEIHLLVPSRWLGQLKAGEAFTFTPDETGTPLAAEVVRHGARIDESSQTLGLTGRVVGNADGLLSGMSGSAQFAVTP